MYNFAISRTLYKWSHVALTIVELIFFSFSIILSIHSSCCMYQFCCSSVTESCPTLCNPTDSSMPGSLVLHYLPERICSNSCSLSWWRYLTISASVGPLSFCLQSLPASGSFPMGQLFVSGGQSIAASASVLPMNVQGRFLLGLTGLISLESIVHNP